MAETNLSQQEADALIKAEKHCIDELEWELPVFGGKVSIPLVSPENTEEYFLDINCNKINLSKRTYQNRVRVVVVLLRLDIDGPPHRNPDGEEIPCPHLHVYRENYADKWAVPLPTEFGNTTELGDALISFMSYCNITQPPTFRLGLFP